MFVALKIHYVFILTFTSSAFRVTLQLTSLLSSGYQGLSLSTGKPAGTGSLPSYASHVKVHA